MTICTSRWPVRFTNSSNAARFAGAKRAAFDELVNLTGHLLVQMVIRGGKSVRHASSLSGTRRLHRYSHPESLPEQFGPRQDCYGHNLDCLSLCWFVIPAYRGAMNEMTQIEIRLQKGMLWKAANFARALGVRCHDGLVWVTEENDSRDVVLGPKEEFVAESAGLVVVQALTDATFTATGRGQAQKNINPNSTLVASYKGMNGEARRKQEYERSIMKAGTIAVLVSIGLALATVSSGAAPQSAQGNVVPTSRATAPYFAQDV